ncbi:malto-oligosyltrehalose synthase [Longimicrobium sp.]|uniref:malto-oligosyltrehalose synthase n=1 Tax=Longimicrobium sp. TaxID=2029185 RepID=UPI002BD0518C|nr:malto-oligosyltrehalose synthase [Longimicrobium sp.]HSU16926.1 malto-oligosyltrehalose synthase [Longimicrobium sp.]
MTTRENTGGHAAPASAAGRIPRSTYRVQLNHGFTFRQAAEVVPYLRELGIGDLYASPYLQARPGSVHGYDITDHASLNAEIGTDEDHVRLAGVLREHGMGHLLDIVPNHMGIAGHTNPWWWDVLEGGPDSPHAAYFDIDWDPRQPELGGKILLPILGDQYGCVLERGELKLVYAGGLFRIEYFENRFPVAPASTAAVLREALARLDGVLDEEHPDRMELESIATALERLPARRRTDRQSVVERRREKIVTQRRLSGLYGMSGDVAVAVDQAVAAFNGTPGDAASFDRLHELLEAQAYRLAFWRVAAEEINYRRFFDVNELAGVRVEVPQVFQDTHRLILRLVREGKVTGLRIDHPDGLFHPRDYLRDLQAETAGVDARERFYVVVEKILTGDEKLPEDWPVAGTVGYEFLNRVNGIFVAGANLQAMDETYRRFTGIRARFRDLVYEKKAQILRFALVSELTVLTTMLDRISEKNRLYRDFTWGALRDALREVVACFPVYRTYIDAFAGEVSDRDRRYVDQAVRLAGRRNPSVSGSIFDFVRDVLLLHWPDSLTEDDRQQHARFVMKFQQLTGPVMAKGVEDTAFYVFNRLVSLNEVGGEPDRFGVSVDEFHAFMAERAERWPGALSASSTHDTKRSEDVRARIDVLSEIPEAWGRAVNRWAGMNAAHRRDEDGEPIPDRNDEYLLYQTLVGAWPLGEMDAEAHGEFISRIQQYMDKATREAKVHTSWINPNEAYDAGLRDFIAAILRREGDNPFLADLAAFHRPIARLGMVNALAQTLVKLTAPGVPDVYQGQEIWDLSLVDPDNRRPVDYALRRTLLAGVRERMRGDRGALCRELVERWEDGRIKLFVTHVALCAREDNADAFTAGEYLPLAVTGARAEHAAAFARRGGGSTLLTIVPRLVATLTGGDVPGAEAWADTAVAGDETRGRWRNLFTGAEIDAGNGGLPLADALGDFPVALLEKVEG